MIAIINGLSTHINILQINLKTKLILLILPYLF